MTIAIEVLESDEFLPAYESFNHLVHTLRSPDTKKMEHGSVESLVQEKGHEVLRLLLQGHLNERAAEEKRENSVAGLDGQERTHCRPKCLRLLTTIFGDVLVQRRGYTARGLGSVFPLDKQLNLPLNDQFSHGVRKRIARLVATASYDKACDSIKRSFGASIEKRQIETLVQKIGQDFSSYQEQVQVAVATSHDLLVMSTDGKGIVMRSEDLREATKKAVQKEQHKLKTRLSRGEKRNRKRMATVAALYTVAPYHRTCEHVLGLAEKQIGSTRPRPKNKKVWASVEKSSESVIDQLLREALKQDPEQQRRWLMLVDGQPSQLKTVYNAIRKYHADVVVVQDFVHVLEYIWKAAYSFYSEGSEEAEKWVLEHALGVLEGKAGVMAGGMRRSATWRQLSLQKRQPVDKCADYLLKNRKRLDYATALKNGWPIATGIIEGACRYLIKDRMDITGARWSLKGAEAILRLRALCSNGELDDYMSFHQEQERIRHYEMVA